MINVLEIISGITAISYQYAHRGRQPAYAQYDFELD